MAAKKRIRRKLRRKVPALRRALPQGHAPAARGSAASDLMVGGAMDPAEKAADHMVDRALSGRAPAVRSPVAGPTAAVHCMCADCAKGEQDKEKNKADLHRAPVPAAPALAAGAASVAAPKSAAQAVGAMGSGRRMSPGERSFFEPRFGHDFRAVRIHEGPAAAQATRALGARAFARGMDIAFAPGQNTARTMAHELAHVVQDDGITRRSFRQCEASADCPPREVDERGWSRREGIKGAYVSSPVPGFLVWNFGVDSTDTAGIESAPNWPRFWGRLVTTPSRKWTVRGFSDCHGTDSLNESLRQARAANAKAALPSLAQSNVSRPLSAPLGECVAANGTKEERSYNRAAFFSIAEERIDFETPEQVIDDRPVYMCSKPIDTGGVADHAFFRIGRPTPGNETSSLQPSDLISHGGGSSCVQGIPGWNYPSDRSAPNNCIRTTIPASDLRRDHSSYPVGMYCTRGPNSNTFVGHIARANGETRLAPSSATAGMPGWSHSPPAAGTFGPNRHYALLPGTCTNQEECSTGGTAPAEHRTGGDSDR